MKIERKIKYISLFIMALCALITDAQQQVGSIRKDIQKESYNENTQLRNKRPVTRTNKYSKNVQEYVLYRSVIRRNLDGQGITDAQQQVGSIRRDIQIESYNENTQLRNKRPVTRTNKDSKNVQEYVLYRSVIRRNLWLEGQGESITQKTADKLPLYFRFSMKNNKGHYQFVEALQGNNLSAMHTISPYIKDKQLPNPNDSIMNSWDKRFSSIGQWLITSDLDGERVVEERAYEAKSNNANLIYAFQPIYNDDSHITGSYTDSWGLPIDIDDSDDHYYGSVVYITLNRQGLDSIVDYIDAKGLCRYNEYGIDQTRYLYDSKDRIISISFHNTVGDRVNNNRGFCSTIYEYNDKDNSCIVTYLDKNYLPVLPIFTEEDNFKKILIRFDSLGRKEEQIVLE